MQGTSLTFDDSLTVANNSTLVAGITNGVTLTNNITTSTGVAFNTLTTGAANVSFTVAGNPSKTYTAVDNNSQLTAVTGGWKVTAGSFTVTPSSAQVYVDDTAGEQLVTVSNGTVTVTNTGVTGLTKGDSFSVGAASYTVDEGYITVSGATTPALNGTYYWDGTTAWLDTGSAAPTDGVLKYTSGTALEKVVTSDVLVDSSNNQLLSNGTVYFNAYGKKLANSTGSVMSVTGTGTGYTVTVSKAFSQEIQLGDTVAITVSDSVGNTSYVMKNVAGAANSSAKFTLSSGGKFKTTTSGAVSVESGTVKLTNIAGAYTATLGVAVGSSTVTLTASGLNSQTVAKNGVFTNLAVGDTVDQAASDVGETTVSMNGVSSTIVVLEGQAAATSTFAQQTVTPVAKTVPVLTSGYGRATSTNSKVYYDATGGKWGLAEFSGSGDGVIVSGNNANVKISDLEKGESVKITDDLTVTTTFQTYTVEGTTLEYKSYTGAGSPLVKNATKYWTLTGTSVSTTGAGTPTASEVTEGITIGTGTEFLFNSSSTGTLAVVANTIVDGVYVLKDGSTSLKSDKSVGQRLPRIPSATWRTPLLPVRTYRWVTSLLHIPGLW